MKDLLEKIRSWNRQRKLKKKLAMAVYEAQMMEWD